MADAAVSMLADWYSVCITDTANLRLTYHGPRLIADTRVVVAFPPFDYSREEPGWGHPSFKKRGIAHVCVAHRRPDWHQNSAFFPAMAACREWLGPQARITSYGFSMGALGALLSARTLEADRAIAISPQASIDPMVPPYERRFIAQWAELDRWAHDLADAMDDARDYIVLYDPLHPRDSRQEAMIPRAAGYDRCLIHGAGHAVIQTLAQAGLGDALFDVVLGASRASTLRQAYRRARRGSFRYLRKVGNAMHEKDHPLAPYFAELARDQGYRRLIKRWSARPG